MAMKRETTAERAQTQARRGQPESKVLVDALQHSMCMPSINGCYTDSRAASPLSVLTVASLYKSSADTDTNIIKVSSLTRAKCDRHQDLQPISHYFSH